MPLLSEGMTRSWNLADAPGISLSMSAATASVAIVLSRAPCMWAERALRRRVASQISASPTTGLHWIVHYS